MDDVSEAPKVLTFQLLYEITNGFSSDMKVGAGSYGNVYKGQNTNGEMIAVKVLHYIPGLDDEQFQKEYHNLASLQHKNIVRLVGYCHETFGEFRPYKGKIIFAETIRRALCFEYMQNRSLDSYLADESSGLDWSTRYGIIKGICHGLKYLHEELVRPMWHLDLKPGNVLLDENMTPKIADFGLSRLFFGEQTQMTKSAIGTHGYVPPEYIDAAVVSIKFDIFSLGVIIIKIITGPTGYFRIAEMSPQHFIKLVYGNWKNRLQATSVSALEPYCEQVKRCIEIALNCVDADRRKRPSIGVIVDKLNETVTAIQLLGTSMNDTGSSMHKAINFPSKQGKKEYASSGMMLTPMEPRSVQLAIKNNKKVMLEITSDVYNRHRPGLDLVAVVDISSSMEGKKMSQLKSAMRFIVRKLRLSPIDRLSIVTFSICAYRLCPLGPISEALEADLLELIDGLSASGDTNIKDGLLAGLNILSDRILCNGRVTGIMLISDGKETYGDAAGVNIGGNVPVYTFGFGADNDPVVLNTVAANSNGGTFSHVPEDIGGGDLTMACSQCLAGLLTVSVQDLKVTLAPVGSESTIVKVTAGSYLQTDHRDGSVTISFGNVYSREVRKVIVDLLLSAAIKSEGNAEILNITYSSSSSSYPERLQFAVPPAAALDVWRTGIGMEVLEGETPAELQAEEARLQAAKMIEEARTMADCGKLNHAQHKLLMAQNLPVESLHRMALLQLLEFFKTPEFYHEYGRSYALSMQSSHGLQRFASTGGDIRLFVTPRMDMYLEQANRFLRELAAPVPSVDEDVVEEVLTEVAIKTAREEALAEVSACRGLPPPPQDWHFFEDFCFRECLG